MAPLSPTTRQHASPDDELDDILNGLAEGRDVGAASTAQQTRTDYSKRMTKDTAGGLGIDEEIIIAKKRIPIPKLDDARLLSDPGIPRLRKISKERLRFKGKGHEYGDIARMLNMYQLWLDDLYPRAKFADALVMVEKVGHTKRMQIMRKDWIDEGKPRLTRERDDSDDNGGCGVDESLPAEARPGGNTDAMEGVEDSIASNVSSRAGGEQQALARSPSEPIPALQDNPDEDELDALLAESASATSILPPPPRAIHVEEDPFADEMDAMADMDDMW